MDRGGARFGLGRRVRELTVEDREQGRGLVGAGLAAIINEAAIRAARRGAALIGKTDVKNALSEYYESRSALNSEQFGPFSFAAPKEQPSN